MAEAGYGLIGEKLGHSFSPYIHGELGGYDYRLIELERGELGRNVVLRLFECTDDLTE